MHHVIYSHRGGKEKKHALSGMIYQDQGSGKGMKSNKCSFSKILV
jgi:hypothetical protein